MKKSQICLVAILSFMVVMGGMKIAENKQYAAEAKAAKIVADADAEVQQRHADSLASKRAAEVVSVFKTRGPVEKIDISEASKISYTFNIWYKSVPTLEQVRGDSTGLVRALLLKLVADGTKTENGALFIHVHTYKKEMGETREGVRDYADASYDYVDDKVTFSLSK